MTLVRCGQVKPATASARSMFPDTPPPPATSRPFAHPARIRQCTALELVVDPFHQPAQICSGTARKATHNLLKVVASILDLQARLPDLGRVQIPPWLSERPLETGQCFGDNVWPQPLVLHPPDRCTGPSRNATDAMDDNMLARPPPLSADGLRTPTRHRPFGSEPCAHCSTERDSHESTTPVFWQATRRHCPSSLDMTNRGVPSPSSSDG
jgi:hypothetical protein